MSQYRSSEILVNLSGFSAMESTKAKLRQRLWEASTSKFTQIVEKVKFLATKGLGTPSLAGCQVEDTLSNKRSMSEDCIFQMEWQGINRFHS